MKTKKKKTRLSVRKSATQNSKYNSNAATGLQFRQEDSVAKKKKRIRTGLVR